LGRPQTTTARKIADCLARDAVWNEPVCAKGFSRLTAKITGVRQNLPVLPHVMSIQPPEFPRDSRETPGDQ